MNKNSTEMPNYKQSFGGYSASCNLATNLAIVPLCFSGMVVTAPSFSKVREDPN